MGGRSYYRTGNRIRYGDGEFTWQAGFWFSVMAGSLLLFVAYNISKVELVQNPEKLLLGLSETRLIKPNAMWVSYIGGGEVAMVDRTPNDKFKREREEDVVKLMKFSEMPPLTASDVWKSWIDCSVTHKDYYYWSWYFYAGTTITVEWKFTSEISNNPPLDAYLVKSEDGFDGFDQWTSSYLGTLKKPRKYIQVYATGNKMTFDVVADDFYFLFFWNSADVDVSGHFEYSVTSKFLNTRNAIDVCTLPCYMPVRYEGDEVFVLVTPRASSFPDSGYSINTDFECRPTFSARWWTVGAILFFPIIGYLILVAIWFGLKHLYKMRPGYEPPPQPQQQELLLH